MRTPPSTSGMPSASACASKPVPTRYSDMIEHLRQLAERADGDGADRRLADVDDDAQRHPATVSRSALDVTLSRRGSPSTTLTRPPAASTRPAQSVVCNRLLLARACLKRSAANAWGVWTAQRPSRDTVSCTPPSQ